MPINTPVLVNGVRIGVSGNTGLSSGPHLHIGRFVNGRDTPPRGGGFNVSGAVVTGVGSDPTDGNYVRVQDADGASWVYLHLTSQSVKVGDKLIGTGVNIVNYDQVDSMAHAYLNDSIANNPGLKYYVGQPVGDVIAAFNGAPERAAFLKHIDDLEKGVVSRQAVLEYISKNLQ